MVKLLGVLLVWGGGVLCGLRSAGQLRDKVRVLEDIGRGLEQLERELTLRRESLPVLLRRAAQRTTRQGRSLFLCCSEELEKGNSFAEAWALSVEQTGLEPSERELLACLGPVLGRYDAAGQAESLAHLRRELEGAADRARERAVSLGRVRCALGAAVGGFLALVLV